MQMETLYKYLYLWQTVDLCFETRSSPWCLLSSPQVHLGGGIWVEEEKWHQLQRTQGDSKFTKNLAVMIWGTETLKNRSVTGVATKKKKDALPKPPLSPSKLKIVRGKILRFKPIKSKL